MKAKQIIASLVFAVISISATTNTVFADYTLIDELKSTEHVASGIEYSKIERLTGSGFIDINMLTLDLENENVNFDILRNKNGFGITQNLTGLIGQTDVTNVVGAVNGSFFHMDTSPTDVIGYEYRNGNWVYMKENYNKAKLEENSVIISNDNDVSFDYLQANTILHNSRGESVRIVSVNGTRDIVNLTLITPYMMKDTTSLEPKGNIFKFVIQNDMITYIGEPKEVVTIPEDGYVLTVNYNSGEKMKSMFPVGEKVRLQLSTNLDSILENTQLLMSGAGTLVKNGQVQLDGLSASPTSRQPRTAVGVNADSTKMFIVTVDGRGSSIGMTNNELANFMISQGSHNAINLDGGGSTTFAVRKEGESQAKVVNKVSDGAERKVLNGLGVLTSPTGEIASLHITPSKENVIIGDKVTFTAYGLDANDNPIAIDNSQITYIDTLDETNVSVNGAMTFQTEGVKLVKGIYNGFEGVALVEAFGSTLDIDITPINLELNGSSKIEMIGTTPNGDKIDIDESAYTFTTNGGVNVSNGTVTSTGTKGIFQISTQIIGKTVAENVSVGASDIYVPLTSFENMKITSKPYPNGNEGATGAYKEKPINGEYAIKTSFNFKNSGKAQAVYSILSNVKITDSRAEKLAVNYFGENKGNSVKAIITDAKGTEKTLIFTNKVDFSGYKRLEVAIPDGLVYPIKVDRLYVASDGKSNISGVGYFDYMTYTIGNSYVAGLDEIRLSYDVENNSPEVKEIVTVTKKANNDITKTYTSTLLENTKLINVSADNGSIVLTDSAYYNKLKNELYNSSSKNIVIVSTQSIDDNTFAIEKEGEMLKNMLEDYREKFDKNIYYVNNHANTNSTSLENKIRYIDLYNKNVSFSLNENGGLSYKSK